MSGIVVGLEDSEGGRAALAWAMDEAIRRHAPLTVISVVNELPVATPGFYAADAAGHYAEREESTQRWVEQEVRDLATRTPDATGLRVDVRTPTGHPAKVLIDASEHASLVVVGSRGAGGFTRLLLGSVSTAVVHHAKCPVVVVPTPGAHR